MTENKLSIGRRMMGLKTKEDCFSYVRRYYGVSPYKGQKVKHAVTGSTGVVVEKRSQQQYVYVDFTGKGQRYASPCHPRELIYDVDF